MEYIISCVWISTELLCCMVFAGAFLERRNSWSAQIPIIISSFIFLFFCVYSIDNDAAKQFVSMGLIVVTTEIIYRGNVLIHFFLVLLCYLFISSIDTAFAYGTCFLLGINQETFIWSKWLYTAVISISKFISSFSLLLFFRFRKKNTSSKIDNRWLFLSILFPATSVVMFVILLFSNPLEQDDSVSIFSFSCILIISNVAILYVLDAIEKTASQEHEVQMLKRNIALQTENFRVLEGNYSIQRKAAHEFEHHIQAIQDLIDKEEYTTAREYLKRIHNSHKKHAINIRSHHPVFDVIINQKYQRAQDQGISMHIQVNDLSTVSIPADLLVVILSNLLDNAMEACLRLEAPREIICNIAEEDGLFISIRNTSPPVYIPETGVPETTKESLGHGYGLNTVIYTLKQLEAEYTFAYEGGWFQFVAEIPAKAHNYT